MSASLWTWTNLWQNPGKKPCDAGLPPLFLTERGGACYTNSWFPLPAAVAKQADARDLKSLGLLTVPVRSRSAAPKRALALLPRLFFCGFLPDPLLPKGKKGVFCAPQNRLSHSHHFPGHPGRILPSYPGICPGDAVSPRPDGKSPVHPDSAV